MNDEDAMSFFAGRRPSFRNTRNGPEIRGFRSRPGAPQANSARLSGKSTTPDSAWNKWFPDAGRAERTGAPQYPVNFLGKMMDSGPMQGAAAEIQQAYDETQKSPLERSVEKHDKIMGAAGPAGNGGIVGQTLEAFGRGYWNKLVGRGPAAPPAPSLYTPAPFMPGQQGEWRGVPKPLTGPMGDKASDRADLAQNASLYAPGGMAGLWGSRMRPKEKWESTTFDQAGALSLKYQPRRARA